MSAKRWLIDGSRKRAAKRQRESDEKQLQIPLKKCRRRAFWRQTVKVLPYTFFTVHTLNGVTTVPLWEKSGAALAETI